MGTRATTVRPSEFLIMVIIKPLNLGAVCHAEKAKRFISNL